MPLFYQLRIEDPEGRLTIHDLDEAEGITAVGQDPANTIVLKNPGVAPVQLRLDHRQEPCRLAVFGPAGTVTVNGGTAAPGSSVDICDDDVIVVAGYTLTFRVYAEEPAGPGVAPAPSPPPEPAPPPPEQPAPEPAGPAIVIGLSEPARTVDVDQTVTLLLTVVNGGDLVADFNVAAEGVPPEWVTITPAEFNLNERAQQTVEVALTPPRAPASRAGTHSLALVVTSPIYPSEQPRATAALTVNPYYELAVGNLSPRHQSISWSSPSAQTEIPLTNRGNTDVLVGLAGEDDARACRFEFQVPAGADEPLYLTRQVDLRVPFDATIRVPVRLAPGPRPLIGRGGRLIDLQPRVHPYTVTVTMAQGEPRAWTLTGEWETTPRFSRLVLWLSILGLVLLLLFGTWWVFHPAISPPDGASAYADPVSIRAGQVVKLDWKAWPPFLVGFRLNGQRVIRPVSVRPGLTTTYELRADTWLSHLLPFWSASDVQTIEVRPVRPDVLLFEARPERTLPGQDVVLSWVVDDAAEVVLIDHAAGLEETLDTPCGSREIRAQPGTARYTLRATGAGGAVVERAVTVQAGSPVIRLFSVEPAAISAPAGVKVAWWVLGPTDAIMLSRSSFDADTGRFVTTPGRPIAARGEDRSEPVDSTTVFTLTVRSGATELVETARVKVLKQPPAAGRSTAGAVAPTAAPAKSAAPGLVVVYTALADNELRGIISATRTASLTGVPGSLAGTGLTLDQLKSDYDYVVTPTRTLPMNLLIVDRSTLDLVRQLLAEKEKPRADVVWMVAATGMVRLRAEGLLEPLDGLYRPPGLESIKAGWSDPTPPAQWVGLSAWQAAFLANPDKLARLEGSPPVPASWKDLAAPVYRGTIAMPSPHSSGTGYMVISGLLHDERFGEQDGWAALDLLHENVAWYTQRGSEACDLAAGSADPRIAICIAANACSGAGRPVQLVVSYPEQGSGWEMDAVALVRKDETGDEALAFLAWTISQEAMLKYAPYRPVLAYAGLKPDQECSAAFDEGQVSPGRYLWASANYERIVTDWQGRYGAGSEPVDLEPAR